jgi:hypothetical protein
MTIDPDILGYALQGFSALVYMFSFLAGRM